MKLRLGSITQSRCFYTAQRAIRLSSPERARQYNDIDDINIDEFREKAFAPSQPALLLRSGEYTSPIKGQSVPAEYQWFSYTATGGSVTNQNYLRQWGCSDDTRWHARNPNLLTYELTVQADYLEWAELEGRDTKVVQMLRRYANLGRLNTFKQFSAPFELLFEAEETNWYFSPVAAEGPCKALKGLYVAQTKISELSAYLQEDLPTPKLVEVAGKGDLYDSNIWLGIHPTYTPLHKDPNPNLFLQLAGKKRIRLFEPQVGSAILQEARRKSGQKGIAGSRGMEMMHGPERDALDELVWSQIPTIDVTKRLRTCCNGHDLWLGPGDALFIPKGWWHSIKSMDTGCTVGSVNWWFR